MTDSMWTTKRGSLGERWRDRPRRVGRAALGWAVAQGAFALACGPTGALPSGDDSRLTRWLSWYVTVVSVPTVGAVVYALRNPGRPAVRRLLWAVCGLSALSAFSLLMDVVGLLFGQGVDSTPRAVLHALGLVGVVLLAATARAHSSTGCPRCGAPHTARTAARPAPSAASRRVHAFAWAGSLAFAPYAWMKTTWVTGGTFAGITDDDVLAGARRNGASDLWLTLESWGVDGTALLAALGVFLLFGLIRPWGQVFPRWTLLLSGRRVPRWLPLAPALIGVGTLLPYGVVGVGYVSLATAGVLPVRRGDFPTADDTLLVAWIGLTAFAVYGVALAVAARSYWFRTRPVCPGTMGSGADGPAFRPLNAC
ncbi:hypothetical protein [Streptomyces hesseae]|uniref:Uncharacterized protein n=1 Tax=Streptomyces hesseae TaxID=3075519 RepID=A0ABU2SF03_9ACTN|nr:hypothetical protein [Streptomyces sp. DSM 40473]MDT0447561.1 hypothetical protein [Streptomyces sp. DSM 40473]